MSGTTLRWIVAASVLLGATGASVAQQNEFPFDRELILDARPMPGSKRIPNMDIAANGTIALEMWCDRVEGQVVVAGDTITVITGQPSGRPCPPDRARGDADLLDALSAVTSWRRQGDTVVLVGPGRCASRCRRTEQIRRYSTRASEKFADKLGAASLRAPDFTRQCCSFNWLGPCSHRPRQTGENCHEAS